MSDLGSRRIDIFVKDRSGADIHGATVTFHVNDDRIDVENAAGRASLELPRAADAVVTVDVTCAGYEPYRAKLSRNATSLEVRLVEQSPPDSTQTPQRPAASDVTSLPDPALDAPPVEKPERDVRIFLSYTTNKDEFNEVQDFGRRLRTAVEQHLVGKKVHVFQDSQSIGYGRKWADAIRNAVDDAHAMVALISPSYLGSRWCGWEASRFVARMEASEARDSFFPVRWIDVFEEEHPLVPTLTRYQAPDWTDLRFETWDHPDKRRALDRLAQDIARSLRVHTPAE